MHTTTIFSGIVSLLAIGAAAAPTDPSASHSTSSMNSIMGLYINDPQLNINYLQTSKLSYANTSAYIGGIKYQSYAEPLVVNDFHGNDNAVTFLSIHSSPTGWQQMYIVPHQSKPVGFSVPHGGSPAGVSTSGFSFGPKGALKHNGLNLFYACQDQKLAAMNAYQIYWIAAGRPRNLTCRGPIKIQAGDGCARY